MGPVNYSNTINPDTLLTDETYHFYKYDKLGTIQRSGYTLDYKDNQKIYFNGDYTDFHLSNDGYWTSGEYEKLLRQLESELRRNIAVQNQLKVQIERMQFDIINHESVIIYLSNIFYLIGKKL